MPRPSLFAIDLDALMHNVGELNRLAGQRQTMAVVKANAYGHGAIACAKALEARVDAFAVAITEEAIVLRQAGVTTPILVLQGPHCAEDFQSMAEHRLWPAISNQQQLHWLRTHCESASATGNNLDDLWLKVDTGMHRLGFAPSEVTEVEALLKTLGTQRVTLMSHLADAENTESPLTNRQIARWKEISNGHSRRVSDGKQTSFSNSASTLSDLSPEETWVRLGYSLYGGSLYGGSMTEVPAGLDLRPVMTFSSRVSAVRWIEPGESVGYGGRWVATRKSRIATIPVGYGDGYPRSATDGTPIGTPFGIVPMVGRVSMDMITVDITDRPEVEMGTEVTMWGKSPSIDEVAAHCNTIGYELCTRVTERTPRVFNR